MRNPMERVNVNKPYLPSLKKYKKYLDIIWKNNHLTNFGPLSQMLENKLCEYLGVQNLLLLGNGTLALQIAYKVLDIKKEVITPSFSFIATTNTLLWENIKPIFCDIDAQSFCIDVTKIASLITSNTKAILPVHVFGNSCEVEIIETIAKQHKLKVIYDAAHAFGVRYKENNILNYGDVSTLSFHATKLFHTIEGGALIAQDKAIVDDARKVINFGLSNNLPNTLGINAKNSEFHAAMGLCILEDLEFILQQRQEIWEYYFHNLQNDFEMQKLHNNASNNYHYFPILFKDEQTLLQTMEIFHTKNIFPRRYFYPSLNTLSFNLENLPCPISEDIARRIVCLPIYVGLTRETQNEIINILLST